MSRDRRVARLEDARKPPKPPRALPPHILSVGSGETIGQARARFVDRWGAVPPGHQFLVVPAMPDGPAEIAAFERATEIRQRDLLIFARQRPQPKEATT